MTNTAVKVKDLSDVQLNWAMAMITGEPVTIQKSMIDGLVLRTKAGWPYEPSKNWAIVGRILENHWINVTHAISDDEGYWSATLEGVTATGDSACRAILLCMTEVCLGKEVHIPKELG